MLRSEALEKVNAVLTAWNERRLEDFVQMMAPDVVWHDLGMPNPPATGRDAVRRFSESVMRAFPDFHFEIRAPICVAEDGESCCVPWTITATHSAPIDPPGFAPTHRTARFDGVDYIVFENGLIKRIETRFDPVDVIGQLTGMKLRPPEGSWRERLLVLAQRLLTVFVRGRVKS